MGDFGTRAVLAEQAWQVRVGQIETVLTYFGTLCSVSVERRDGVTVYVQARRIDEGLEIEAIGNTYLPRGHQLTETQVEHMAQLGWEAPQPPASPNFGRLASRDADLHVLATLIACTLRDVYAVQGDETWVVSPPEFGQSGAGFEPLEVVDPEEEFDPQRVLREASGIALATVVAGDAVTFADCIAAGLPRGDRMAEMAMLYRPDCTVEFLRQSPFHLNVLADPQLPVTTARAVLAAEPSSYEIRELSARKDLPRHLLRHAAERGHRVARFRGKSGGDYLRLGCVPPARLTEIADQQDGEAVGLLANVRCPEDVVLRYVLARPARVRYAALSAVKRRNLAVDSALIRAARDLPMTERPGTAYPHADRTRALADQILAAR